MKKVSRFAQLVILCTGAMFMTAMAAEKGAEPVVKKQTMCPVMGGKINSAVYADYEGKRVYFCCAGCVEKFKKDPAKYVAKVEKAGVTLEKAPEPKVKDAK